jgi:hypothetical protein
MALNLLSDKDFADKFKYATIHVAPSSVASDGIVTISAGNPNQNTDKTFIIKVPANSSNFQLFSQSGSQTPLKILEIDESGNASFTGTVTTASNIDISIPSIITDRLNKIETYLNAIDDTLYIENFTWERS